MLICFECVHICSQVPKPLLSYVRLRLRTQF